MLTRQRQVQFETNLLLNVGLSIQNTHISPNWTLYLETEVGGTNDDDKNTSSNVTQRSYILGRVEQFSFIATPLCSRIIPCFLTDS